MKLKFISKAEAEEWVAKLAAIQSQRIKVVLPDAKQIFLTPRESVIVVLLMLGDRAKQIAWKLNISLHTVNSHVSNIKAKLNCNTNFEVGYRLGWFDLMAGGNA